MTYDDLSDILEEMSDADRTATVKVRVGNCKDLCDVKDIKSLERSMRAGSRPTVFLEI